MVSKALLCVLLVTFCLLVIARPVIARPVPAPLVASVSQSVPSDMEEPLFTELVIALQQIATDSNRTAELLSNDWSWIKVQLGLFVGTILGEVIARYLVDCGRKTSVHWGSLRPLPLEKVLTPLFQNFSKEVEGLSKWVEGLSKEVSKWVEGLSKEVSKEVSGLRAEAANFLQHLDTSAKKGAEALDRVAMTTACTERQLAAYVKKVDDLQSVVANLQAQLDEMNTNNQEIDKSLEDSEPRPKDGLPDPIEGEVVTPAYLQAATCRNNSGAPEGISCDANWRCQLSEPEVE